MFMTWMITVPSKLIICFCLFLFPFFMCPSCYYKLLSRKSGRHQEIENVSAVQMEIIRKWILVVRSPSDLPAHDAILILNLKNLMVIFQYWFLWLLTWLLLLKHIGQWKIICYVWLQDYAMHYRIGPWKNYHNTSFSLFWGICLFYFVFCENTITCKFNGVESGFSALESWVYYVARVTRGKINTDKFLYETGSTGCMNFVCESMWQNLEILIYGSDRNKQVL